MKKVIFALLCIGLPTVYLGYMQRCNAQKMQKEKSAMKFESSIFNDGQTIPEKYTCKGRDISPPLSWSNAPKATRSFALIVDDPDAPMDKPFVHWIVYNLASHITSLPENVLVKDLKGLEGKNDFKKIGYGGPCPPQGHGIHHYQFILYALAIKLDLSEGATKEALMQAMQGHVLGKAELIGTFEIK